MEIDYSQELLNHMTPFGYEIKIVDIIIILVTVGLIFGTIVISLVKFLSGTLLNKKQDTVMIKTIQEIRKFNTIS